jgi:hypothetical protein
MVPEQFIVSAPSDLARNLAWNIRAADLRQGFDICNTTPPVVALERQLLRLDSSCRLEISRLSALRLSRCSCSMSSHCH